MKGRGGGELYEAAGVEVPAAEAVLKEASFIPQGNAVGQQPLAAVHLTGAILAARRGNRDEVEVWHRQKNGCDLWDPVDCDPGHLEESVLNAGAVNAALCGPEEGVGHGALDGIKRLAVVFARGGVPAAQSEEMSQLHAVRTNMTI
jgi:hypothetical protein